MNIGKIAKMAEPILQSDNWLVRMEDSGELNLFTSYGEDSPTTLDVDFYISPEGIQLIASVGFSYMSEPELKTLEQHTTLLKSESVQALLRDVQVVVRQSEGNE